MITWATDYNGVTTYICDEWHKLTGQQPSEALGFGWLDAIHPEDRSLVQASFAEACRSQVEFLLRYRLRRGDGSYIWVVGGAKPSFTPLSHEFLGFLGLVSCYDDTAKNLTAVAEVGSLEPIGVMFKLEPASRLDNVASHLIMARAASVGCPLKVIRAIDNALDTVGRAIATEMQSGDVQDPIH